MRPVYPPLEHNGRQPRKRRHIRMVENVRLPQRYDKEYVAFLHSFGCELGNHFSKHICRSKNEVHHDPMGANKDDRMALCLCNGAHQGEIHGMRGFPAEFESREEWKLWEKGLQQRRMLQYLDRL